MAAVKTMCVELPGCPFSPPVISNSPTVFPPAPSAAFAAPLTLACDDVRDAEELLFEEEFAPEDDPATLPEDLLPPELPEPPPDVTPAATFAKMLASFVVPFDVGPPPVLPLELELLSSLF